MKTLLHLGTSEVCFSDDLSREARAAIGVASRAPGGGQPGGPTGERLEGGPTGIFS